MDLVAAEALRTGVLDGLAPSGLAAALSTLVYEARRPDDVVSPRVPGGDTRCAIDALELLWPELDELEREHQLDFLRGPTSASPGRPTAGARVTTSTTCSTRATWPPVTSCAGSSS